MKTHIATSPEKTRRASVYGKHVQFFRRPPSSDHYRALVPVMKQDYDSHEQACLAADHFAETGRIRFREELRKPPALPLFEARP
jgi:hypothetical protein